MTRKRTPNLFALIVTLIILAAAFAPVFGCGRADPVRHSPRTDTSSSTRLNLMIVPVESLTEGESRKPIPAMAPVDAAVDETRTLKAGPESSKVEFLGKRFSGPHDGGFREFSAAAVVDPRARALISFEAAIATDSVWAKDDAVTRQLTSPDFFDPARYPVCSFASTRVDQAAAGGLPNGANTVVTGNLTLRGVTRTITFPAEVKVQDPLEVSVRWEFVIDRKDFGIASEQESKGPIGDDLMIRMELNARRR
jgi:polyisoprenoid-binding protein YceI